LLALVAELVGRSLIYRIDVGRYVRSPVSAGTDYYPILLAAVKLGVALLLARLVWRIVKARSTERAARRLFAAMGTRPRLRAPKVRLTLSPRLWASFFAATSVIYLVQTDAEQMAAGRWPLLAPWLHSSALPVFAVLAVLMALVWSAVQRWLAEYERFAEQAAAEARRLVSAPEHAAAFPAAPFAAPPRELFGLAFESRPPPAPASPAV